MLSQKTTVLVDSITLWTHSLSPALHTIVSKNWVPPEDGPSYLEAYYKYFVDRGEPAPQIKVVSGRVNKEKGFYGQLQYEGICHFPLGELFFFLKDEDR